MNEHGYPQWAWDEALPLVPKKHRRQFRRFLGGLDVTRSFEVAFCSDPNIMEAVRIMMNSDKADMLDKLCKLENIKPENN